MKIGLFLSLSFVLNRRWEMEDCIGLLSPLLTFLVLEKSCVVIYCFELLEDMSVFSRILFISVIYALIHYTGRLTLLKWMSSWNQRSLQKLMILRRTPNNLSEQYFLPRFLFFWIFCYQACIFYYFICLPVFFSFPFTAQKQPQPAPQFLRNKKPKILFSPWKPKVY